MIQRALTTLPEMLKANGYRTAAIGKYHVGMSFDDGDGGIADDFYFHDVDFTKPILDGPTHHGFDEYFGVPGNTEDPLDAEPRILIRNDRFTFTDRSQMKRIGMKHREGQILAAPDWDLRDLGPRYLREAEAFIDRQAQNADEPFFLYYVPNANHYQRHPGGDYAVPDEIAGTRIKGQSRYSDDAAAGDREDMVLENDVAFGALLRKLRTSNDPRWPGHKLIENTLVIFTSDNGPNVGDNLGRNQESGGLRGKKAKLWEGGIRVPFMVSWPAVLEGGTVSRSIVTLTDLYATLAHVVGHSLATDEAHDSHDVFEYWTGSADSPDTRPRVFFCHLGPPYRNDVLAIRQGSHKLIVDGGLAMPWTRQWSSKGSRGSANPTVLYDLAKNPFEVGDNFDDAPSEVARQLAATLLRIHNRGHTREFNVKDGPQFIVDPGWHNLRNDVTGEIGVEFKLRDGSGTKFVTHLGMWDDHDADRPVRAARAVPDDHENDQPSRFVTQKSRRRIKAPHVLRLLRLDENNATEMARIQVAIDATGELHDSFRYFPLSERVELNEDTSYVLLMSTTAADGDQFRDPAAFDGLSPLFHSDVSIERSVLIRPHDPLHTSDIPAFEDLSESYHRFRAPIGPTLRFGE